MIRKLFLAIKYDTIIQFKSGFYYAYIFICAIYIVVLRIIPENLRSLALTETIFTDPSIFGYFFIGALIMLEKDYHTIEPLFITPITIRLYVVSKIISLTALSLITSFIIAFFIRGANCNYLFLFIGVVLSSTLFILVGISVCSRTKKLASFIFLSIPILIFICLPMIEFFRIIELKIFYLLPGKASIILIDSAFNKYGAFDIIYSVTYLSVLIFLAFVLAEYSFKKKILEKI